MLMLAFLVASAACGGSSKPAAPAPQPSAACVRGGCSGELCEEAEAGTVTTCEFKPEHACYREAACARQADGACGWTTTDALTACLADPPPLEGEAAEFPISPM